MAEDDEMAALGELICRLNPLTNLPPDPATGKRTGDMRLGILPAADGPHESSLQSVIARIAVEADGQGEHWTFKGRTEAIRTAARIPYRFPVRLARGEEYWQTENLLIGYTGGGGAEPVASRAERRADEAERRADMAFQRAVEAERRANEAHRRAESAPALSDRHDDAAKQEPASTSGDSESIRVNHVVRAVSNSLATSRNLWEVIIGLQSGLQLTYEALSVPERIRNLGAELLLTAIYLILFGWFALSHINSLSYLPQLASYIVPDAFADDKVHAPSDIRIILLTLNSIGVFGVLIISSYASMLRKPPLQSAKEVLKIVLGFTTGQLTLAGFLT
jgi:hypothetical protein